MKRLMRMLLLLMMLMLLCACAAEPAGTTLPPETTLPQTITPTGTTAPPETTVPPETTLPGVFEPYTVPIEDPEAYLYAGPAFVHGISAMVGEAGTYTIVEEITDADGNLWGRLKSGAGWLCLTNPPLAPIYADYAEETFNAFHAYWTDETDYITSIGFTPAQTLTDVKFGLLDWFETESWQMAEVLYTIDEMDPDHAFLAQVVFWGDMTTYGITFTDEDGNARHYALSISGKDGSLICQEYVP